MTEVMVPKPKRNFDAMVELINAHAQTNFQQNLHSKEQLWKVNVHDKSRWPTITDAYLQGFPEEDRDTYNCRTCFSFLNRVGRTVFITKDDGFIPLLLPTKEELISLGVEEYFHQPLLNMREYVTSGKDKTPWVVMNYEVGFDKQLGDRYKGLEDEFDEDEVGNLKEWSHFYLDVPDWVIETRHKSKAAVIHNRLLNVKMLMETVVAYRNTDWLKQVLHQANAAGPINRKKEKVIDPLEWLISVVEIFNSKAKGKSDFITYMSYNHLSRIKNSVLGKLLDNIYNGDDFSVALRKADVMLDALNYMCSTKEVSGNLVQTVIEKFAEKGILQSLERKLASVEDICKIWVPEPVVKSEPKEPTPWEKLLKKTGKSLPVEREIIDSQSKVSITMRDFIADVLPSAKRIEVLINNSVPARTYAFLTEKHKGSTPILKWDKESNRYPISSVRFIHDRVSKRTDLRVYGLKGGQWLDCVGICKRPSCFGVESFKDFDYYAFMSVVETRIDFNHSVFNEDLTSNFPILHEHRAVVEQISNQNTLPEGSEAVIGIAVHFKEQNPDVVVRVVGGDSIRQEYVISIW